MIRHRFVSFYDGVAVRINLVVEVEFDEIAIRAPAGGNYVSGEIDIPLFARKLIQLDDRFEDRARIYATPPVRRLDDRLLARADLGKDIIGVRFFRFENVGFKCLVAADAIEVFEPDENVFSAPHIPAAEFVRDRIRRNSSELVARGQNVLDRFGKHVVQLLVARDFVNRRAAAHLLAEIFAAPPSVVVRVRSENFRVTLPFLAVFKLIFCYKLRVIAHNPADFGVFRHKFDLVFGHKFTSRL